MHIVSFGAIYLILALGLNVIVGYAGLLTLAHAGFFAVGGYSYALLSVRTDLGFLPSIIVAATIGAIGGRIMALLAERVGTDSFVLISLAMQAWLFGLLANWWSPHTGLGTIRNLTNGPFGIAGVPRPAFLGFHLSGASWFTMLTGVVTGVVLLLHARLLSSPWGRMLKAIRDDELGARALGKHTSQVRAQALMVGCAAASVAGVLYCSFIGYIGPEAASLNESIFLLSFVLVGGVGNLRGPVVGTVSLVTLNEVLRVASIPGPKAAVIRVALYGAALVVAMRYRPQGIAGEYRFD